MGRVSEDRGTPFRVVDCGCEGSQQWMTLECQCGNRVRAWLWSWSGHGVKPCPSCKGRMFYSELTAKIEGGGY